MDYYSFTKECNSVILSNANGNCAKRKYFLHFLAPTRFFEKYGVEIVVISIWQGRSGRGYTEKMVIVYEYSYVRGIVTFNSLVTL